MKKFLLLILSFLGSGASGYFAVDFTLKYFNDKSVDPTFIFVFLGSTIICISIFISVIFYHFNQKYKSKLFTYQQKLKQWENTGYRITQAGGYVINYLPVSIILFDEGGAIKWCNPHAKEKFGIDIKDNGIFSHDELSLSDISEDLKINVNLNNKAFMIKHKNSSYDVVYIKEDSTLFLFDETEREEIKKTYDEHIPSIAIIGLDNIDNALKKYDVQEQSHIKGLILGEISNWADKYMCHLEPLSSEKLIAITNKHNLVDMVNDKFSVSNNIREICEKHRLKSSVSMGISCYDTEFKELGTMSHSLIDLAERRGGDQIVVNIQHEKVQYFGGNNNSQEKNTLVEVRSQAMTLKEAIEASSNVLIMCHNFADCDAIGSMIAMYHLAKSSNVEVKMVFEESRADVTVKKIFAKISENPVLRSRFISEIEALEYINNQTLLIVTDTQSPKLVMFSSVYNKANRLYIVDHHRAGEDGYKNYISYYVESSASSTVELVVEMFNYYNEALDITVFEASVMLAGIIVDTNNFTVRSGQRTFEAAGMLKSMGADMIYVRKLLQESLEIEKVLAKAIGSAEIYGEKFAIVSLDENDRIQDRTTLAKISDKQLTIEGVEASFTIGRIDSKTVGVSARSLGDTVNVQSIMEIMDGGGHFNSAATQVSGKLIAEVKEQLIELLRLEYIEGVGEKMKIILLEDVKGKGKKNQIIEVANGFGNHLIQSKKAVLADDKNIAERDTKLAAEKKAYDIKRQLQNKLKEEITGKRVTITIKIGANNKSFETVTKMNVIDEFYKQNGILIEKNCLELPGQINSVGIYTATVKLDTDIIAKFEVNVEASK